jgi:hypothetical protein
MGTFSLKRFAHQETLKSIRPDHLLALLGRHGTYFMRRGVNFTGTGSALRVAEPIASYGAVAAVSEPAAGIDYESIARVLMTPDETTPRELVDDLFFVDEMSARENMDALREEISKLPPAQRKKLELGPDPTPADVAVMVRLHAPDILEKKHAESLLVSKRSFQYFQPANGKRKPLSTPTDAQLRTLEGVFDDAFDQMKRGRNTKVYVFERPDEVWLLVRHGDPCKREGALEKSGSSSVYYRPEVFDVIRYDRASGELSINAGSCKKIYDLYREKLGLHLFGDALHFPAGKAKFTLDPLRTDGQDSLVCSDIDGMESVVLKEVQYFWGGPESYSEVLKASDLFAYWTRRNRKIPEKARISRAKFQVKFSDSKTPGMVAITNSNVTSFSRDGDASAVEAWMAKRGFALATGDANA